MEQQALVAHGASLLLKERYDSDKVTVPICIKCGAVAIEDSIKNIKDKFNKLFVDSETNEETKK